MSIQCPTFTRVLRLRLKDKHARTLREHAYWVNQVWNYCNELSFKVLQRERRFLSGFDLQKYTAGATREGLPLHSQTVQAIAEEYALRRKQFKKTKLRWRVSNPKSSKYSLGWIPFKASALRYRSGQVQEHHRVCAVDVGINTAATAAIVDLTGTVIARTFLTCGRHNHQRDGLQAQIAHKQPD